MEPEGADYHGVTRITTQARVVFIGACFIGPAFEQLWNINNQSVGQVMIVPSNPSATVSLGYAFVAWEEFLYDMTVKGMTAQAAVQETNTYLPTVGITQPYTWIGDGNVKLK